MAGSDKGCELYKGIKASGHSQWLEDLTYTHNVVE